MSNKLTCTILAICIIVIFGALIAARIDTVESHSLNDQCIRRGYAESMDLWGLQWCVRMEDDRLVGVQVEGGR